MQDFIIYLLISISIIFYFSSSFFAFKNKSKLSFILFFAGFISNIILKAFNWIICGYPPFANMYHVIAVLPLGLFPLCFLILKRYPKLKWLNAYFSLTAGIPMVGLLFMNKQLEWSQMPALKSVYFVPHVLSYMISYALFAVAFILGIVKLFDKKSLKNYDFAIYQTILIGFPFMTCGLMLGSIWAEAAWGNYWTWDAKEVWALITWFIYLIYLHCHLQKPLHKFCNLSQIVGFCSLLITFFAVNLMPAVYSSLHSYT
jgi:ABC-type transport system involved in cytochrome c biogenesis, permease component